MPACALRPFLLLAAVLLGLALGGCGREEDPPPIGASEGGGASALVDALRDGGHVLVVRHTTTEATTDRVEVVGDCAQQRNLNAQGRTEAEELGAAMRELGVPVAQVRASPLCRTLETAELMAVGRVAADEDLISPGVIGTEADDQARAARLRGVVAERLDAAGNLVLVTHTGTIGDAFGESLLEGEALVFRPEGGGGTPQPVGRIALEDWRAATGG